MPLTMGSKLWRCRPGCRGTSGSATSPSLPVSDHDQDPVVLVRAEGIDAHGLAPDEVIQITPRLLAEWLAGLALLAGGARATHSSPGCSGEIGGKARMRPPGQKWARTSKEKICRIRERQGVKVAKGEAGSHFGSGQMRMVSFPTSLLAPRAEQGGAEA